MDPARSRGRRGLRPRGRRDRSLVRLPEHDRELRIGSGPVHARAERAALDRARHGLGLSDAITLRSQRRVGAVPAPRVAMRCLVLRGALGLDRLTVVRAGLARAAAGSGQRSCWWCSCSSAPGADSRRCVWALAALCAIAGIFAPGAYLAATTSRPRRRAPLCRPRARTLPTWCSWCSTRSAPTTWRATGTRATPARPSIALAREGVWFADATSPATWSLPAHASLFTGRYPSSHGATRSRSILDDRYPTLAEMLAARGYETFCFTAEPVDQRRPRPHARVRGAEPVVEDDSRGQLVRGPAARAARSRCRGQRRRARRRDFAAWRARGPRTAPPDLRRS